MLTDLVHEPRNKIRSDYVDAIVVVAEHRELTLGFVIDDQSCFVANDFHARVTNG